MKKMIKLMSVSNALLARSATDGNEDVSKLANKAIIDSFMPVSRTLLIEAKYLMNEQAKEMLNPWLVKQSISRGIQWMATHPIRNSEVMKYIFSHYALKESAETIINNEIVCEKMEEVTALCLHTRRQHRLAALVWWKICWITGSIFGARVWCMT